MSAQTLKTKRAEACLREILRVASCGQVSLATAAVLIDGQRDRAALLSDLRAIKAQAIQAEVLLRSYDPADSIAGLAQAEHRNASHSGDAVSNPSPAPANAAR